MTVESIFRQFEVILASEQMCNNPYDIKSKLDKNYSKLDKIDLASLRQIEMNPIIFNRYYQKLDPKSAEAIRFKGNFEFNWDEKRKYVGSRQFRFVLWIDPKTDNPVAYVLTQKLEDVDNAIDMLEVFSRYKNHGLARQILRFAISRLGVRILEVQYDNKIALNTYLKEGFQLLPERKELVDEGKKTHYILTIPGTKVPENWIY